MRQDVHLKPLNCLWTRCRFIVTPHPDRMYRQFPRVYIHLNIVQMMDLCLNNNRLPQKSESLKISPDRYSPPDSLWSREVARWLFVEVWITATFLLEMNRVFLFGEQVGCTRGSPASRDCRRRIIHRDELIFAR
jgi:hypothetical protein